MTTESTVINYTLANAQKTHTRETFQNQQAVQHSQFSKVKKSSRQRLWSSQSFSKCRKSRNFVAASAVRTAEAVSSSESHRENEKNLPVTRPWSRRAADGTSIEEGRRECVAVATLGFFGAGARCGQQYTNVDSMFARKLFTTSSASACRAFGTQWSEHFKLTDVLELGRLGIRLLLGFIDQQLEGGGVRDGSWWSRAAPSC